MCLLDTNYDHEIDLLLLNLLMVAIVLCYSEGSSQMGMVFNLLESSFNLIPSINEYVNPFHTQNKYKELPNHNQDEF